MFAAKPVSLLSFYDSYSNLDIIRTIQQNNQFDGNIGAFLLNESNSVSEKLATMNALIGHNKNNNAAETFKMLVSRQYKANYETLDLNILSANELLCLGYLTLIDDQGNPDNALPILEKASVKSQTSKSVQIIYALISAQSLINKGQTCEAWNSFKISTENSALTNDLDGEIAGRIVNEMQVYNEGCN